MVFAYFTILAKKDLNSFLNLNTQMVQEIKSNSNKVEGSIADINKLKEDFVSNGLEISYCKSLCASNCYDIDSLKLELKTLKDIINSTKESSLADFNAMKSEFDARIDTIASEIESIPTKKKFGNQMKAKLLKHFQKTPKQTA